MACYIDLVFQEWSTPCFEWENKADHVKYGSTAIGISDGFWLDSRAFPPTGYQTRKKRIPDVFPMPGCNAVSQRFKDLVDELEPDTHQFFPIKLRDSAGNALEQNYYVFNCMVVMDAVLVAESGLAWEVSEEYPRPRARIREVSDLVFSKQKVANHHLWKGLYLSPAGSGVFCSDVFHKELKKRKIRYLEMIPCREIDAPWHAEANIQPILDWEAEHGLPGGYMAKRKAEVLKTRGKLEL